MPNVSGDMAWAADDAFVAEAASVVKPGDFRWSGADTGQGPIRIVVDIATQRAFVYRADALIGVSTVSTGSAGHETPVGTFKILQKDAAHKSTIYDDAPMPYMLRLTWDGIALHGGRNPGYPASHGCVRLPTAFAKKLFQMTRLGADVVVQEDGAAPAEIESTPDAPTSILPPPSTATPPADLYAAN